MCRKSQVCVSSVCLGKIRNKVIKATVMGVANGTNSLEELIRSFGSLGSVCNKAESIFVLDGLATAHIMKQKKTNNLFCQIRNPGGVFLCHDAVEWDFRRIRSYARVPELLVTTR